MMNEDLISRQDAIKAVERRIPLLVGDKRVHPTHFIHFLENRPAVEAEPVRHGHWIEVLEEDGFDSGCWMCSECEHISQHDFALVEEAQEIGDMLYCQHCGTRMDGE